MPTTESAAGAIRNGEVMDDKAVGKLWAYCLVIYGNDRESFEKDNVVQLIRKLVEERAKWQFACHIAKKNANLLMDLEKHWQVLSANAKQHWGNISLHDFGIDPKEWLKAELIADTKADILKIYRRLHPDE